MWNGFKYGVFSAILLVAKDVERLAKSLHEMETGSFYGTFILCVSGFIVNDSPVHVMPRKPHVCFCDLSFF